MSNTVGNVFKFIINISWKYIGIITLL